MNILFVDDTPEVKVEPIIQYLQKANIEFTYEIKKSVGDACRYIDKNYSSIDLAIIDLGLPAFDDGTIYDELNGLHIVDLLIRKNKKLPIIINSTTHLPNSKLKRFAGSNIKKKSNLSGEILLDYIQKM